MWKQEANADLAKKRMTFSVHHFWLPAACGGAALDVNIRGAGRYEKLVVLVLHGSRKRLKVVGAENQIPLICGEIPEFSRVLMDFCGCKTVFLKEVRV